MDDQLYQQAYQLIDSKHPGRIAVHVKWLLKPAIRLDSSPISEAVLFLSTLYHRYR